MKFTETEIQTLHVGETFGPFTATRRDIHRAQANICNYKARWPGASFVNKSEPATHVQPDGNTIVLTGWYTFSVTRTGIGMSPDTGEYEPIKDKP